MTTPKHEPIAFWTIRSLSSYSNEEFLRDLTCASEQRRRRISSIGAKGSALPSPAQKASLLAYMMLWDLLRATHGIDTAPLFEYPSNGFAVSRNETSGDPLGQDKTARQAQKRFRTGKSTTAKPQLKDHPDIHFSLSHTKNAALAVVSNVPVGADIQASHNPKPALAKRVLNQTERQAIEKLEGRKQALAFAEIWARKEAFLKLQETGIKSLETLKNLKVPSDHLTEEGHSTEEGFAWCICAKPETRALLPLSTPLNVL